MEYLYLFLESKQPAVLQFAEEWSPLHDAVSVDIPTLRSGVAQIGAKLKLIERRVDAAAKSGVIAGDEFGAVMRPFHGAASRQFADLKDDHERIMKDLAVLAAFLGETRDSTAAFLKTLNEFRKQFAMTAAQCAARRKKEEERRKREQWKRDRAKTGKHKAQKSGDKFKGHQSMPSGQTLPPPLPEDDSKEERVATLSASNQMKGGGLPPPPKSDQMLASLMRNDSEALMNKLRNRRKKSNKRPSQH